MKTQRNKKTRQRVTKRKRQKKYKGGQGVRHVLSDAATTTQNMTDETVTWGQWLASPITWFKNNLREAREMDAERREAEREEAYTYFH